jgi:hypothetical protein
MFMARLLYMTVFILSLALDPAADSVAKVPIYGELVGSSIPSLGI